MKIKIRQAEMKDVPDILNLEESVWPEGLRASKEQFFSRIKTFPEGTLLAEEIGTKNIVGVVVTEIVTYDLKNPVSTWEEITDNGFIKGSHNLEGNTLYGVDLSVSRFANSASSSLLVAIGKMVIKRNLKQAILGARIPRYHKYSKKMSVERYVYGKKGKRPFDPELAFYSRMGLQIAKILPNYIDDIESNNYGVLLLWKNPFFGIPFPKLWSFFFKK
jgi:hypothetical protein